MSEAITSVRCCGPPPVRAKTMSNTWKLATTWVTARKNVVGRSRGMVMRHSWSPGAGAVDPRGLVDRAGDAGESGLEEQRDVADVLPDRHECDRGQGERRVGQPFDAHAQDLVQRADGWLEDPLPHHAQGERRAHPR